MQEKELKLTLLTNSRMLHHQGIELLKNIIRKLFWWKIYGPIGVLKSLDRGFQALKKEGINLTFNINPPITEIYPIVFVLRGADTLSYAISLKKKWIIKKLYAGPNISVPKDKHDIWFHPAVDQIIVPSQRVFDYHCSLGEKIWERMQICPAGVEDLGISSKRKKTLIVFKKTCPEALSNQILEYLQKKEISYHLLEYGKFTPADYQYLINQSRAMIYLQESETQGLALQEAWMKDLPSYVWDRWYRQYQDRHWEGNQISCPYLTKECGECFHDFAEFEEKFPQFWQKTLDGNFHPRAYCLQELSDKVCAKKLLNLSLWTDF